MYIVWKDKNWLRLWGKDFFYNLEQFGTLKSKPVFDKSINERFDEYVINL